MSQLERIEGRRWANQTATEIGVLLARGHKGLDDVITVLSRGTQQKPKDYAEGVNEVIDLIRSNMQ